jgi:23S rRNA (adenine-N6)-dimethyltransferase
VKKRHRIPVRYTGQHFTIDTVLTNDAIRLVDIQKNDLVLDIGAGSGFITVHLAKCSNNVVAIENDNVLISKLRSKFNMPKNVLVAGADSQIKMV